MRIYDIRQRPLCVAQQVKVGSNFATTCDIFKDSDTSMIATGHRGFNADGSEVKLWDTRAFTAAIGEFKGHSYSTESVRFLPGLGPDP